MPLLIMMPSLLMPPEPIPTSLLPALDMAAFGRHADGSFRLLGTAPAWLQQLWPDVLIPGKALYPGKAFLFLDHFLEAADVCWMHRQEGERLASGPWTETGPGGHEWALEAVALFTDGRPLLLIQFPTTDHRTLRRILQESRQQGLDYFRLVKEVDRREVLLHCIVHDLSNPLAGIRGSLKLMREDALVQPDGEELLRIGLHQVEKMQGLIGEILSAFAREVGPLLPTLFTPDNSPDVAASAREVTGALAAAAALKDVRFALNLQPEAADWYVAGETVRLERVLFNLTENALRYATPGSTITLRLCQQGETICVAVEDQGEGVPEKQRSALFSKFAQGKGSVGKAGLGLYFCRITVEAWGGKIGYAPGEAGGACFWFELPKP
ncbi:MAG: sensor histidine kinase [Rhodothermales bacterium]